MCQIFLKVTKQHFKTNFTKSFTAYPPKTNCQSLMDTYPGQGEAQMALEEEGMKLGEEMAGQVEVLLCWLVAGSNLNLKKQVACKKMISFGKH